MSKADEMFGKIGYEELINHSVINNTEIILWTDYFDIIKVNNDYIFQWADKDLRR